MFRAKKKKFTSIHRKVDGIQKERRERNKHSTLKLNQKLIKVRAQGVDQIIPGTFHERKN